MDESWMLPQEAVEFVLEHVEPGSVVVEFGSGHGSEMLSQHLTSILLNTMRHGSALLPRTTFTHRLWEINTLLKPAKRDGTIPML